MYGDKHAILFLPCNTLQAKVIASVYFCRGVGDMQKTAIPGHSVVSSLVRQHAYKTGFTCALVFFFSDTGGMHGA